MSDNAPGRDRQRSEQLRATLSEADIKALAKRAKSDPRSLTLDELGVLFLVSRDRIRAIEAKARRNAPGRGGWVSMCTGTSCGPPTVKGTAMMRVETTGTSERRSR